MAGLLACAAALPGCAGGERQLTAFERSLQPALKTAVADAPELDVFYHGRDYRPLWITGDARPEAADALIRSLRQAGAHGLDPARYDPRGLETALAAARAGDRAAIARAELMLSRAFTTYIGDLRTPAEGARLNASHRALEENALELLTAAAAAPSLAGHLAEAEKMHPIYEGLRTALARPDLAPQRRTLLRANLERARVLPGESEEDRYVLVDVAAQRLWMYEGGAPVDSMAVAVGMPRHATPALSGLISHATVNPYWNLPPDLVRDRAQRVLREGPQAIRRERLELLDGWDDDAHVLQPAEVDWAAVAAGRKTLRMRQLPGGDNVMGRIKFMMPNPLGIYLHDTPDKTAFWMDDRRLSSGCVRVEDAPRLAEWLFDGAPPPLAGPIAEDRVDLPAPVPVYIVYLTAAPGETGIDYRRDIYRRDPALLASLRAEPQPERT